MKVKRTKRAKMGRPPLPPGKRRGLHITVRLTEAEREKLDSEAARLGISISELVMRPWRGKGKSEGGA